MEQQVRKNKHGIDIARSATMRAIRSKDSKIETSVRLILWRKGFRYRKNVASMRGKPDLVFRKKHVVVFVDSCYWHGCPKHCRMPSSNREYWTRKISNNVNRDKETTKYYRNLGWTVVRAWEHQIKDDFQGIISKIIKAIA
jgi:DNA mismatch endonuclease (patch repair protein)